MLSAYLACSTFLRFTSPLAHSVLPLYPYDECRRQSDNGDSPIMFLVSSKDVTNFGQLQKVQALLCNKTLKKPLSL
jgi:hypothetical protein